MRLISKGKAALLSIALVCATALGVGIFRQEIRISDLTGIKYLGFKAPTALTTSTTFTFPDGDGSAGQYWATNGSGTLGWTSPATNNSPDEITNLGLSASLSSNQLVIALKQSDGSTDPTVSAPTYISFRNASTLGAGRFYRLSYTAGQTITLPAAATLGLLTGTPQSVNVYMISDATSELCVSASLYPSSRVLPFATTVISAGATSATAMYCTNAHSSGSPIRYLGYVIGSNNGPNWAGVSQTAALPDVGLPEVPGISFNGSQGVLTFKSPASVNGAYVGVANNGSTMAISNGDMMVGIGDTRKIVFSTNGSIRGYWNDSSSDLIVNSALIVGGSSGPVFSSATLNSLLVGSMSKPLRINYSTAGPILSDYAANTLGVYESTRTASLKPVMVSYPTATYGLLTVRGRATTGVGSCSLTDGEGWSCSRVGVGQYAVSFSLAFADTPVCVASPYIGTSNSWALVNNAATSGFQVWVGQGAATADSIPFTFICMGQRPTGN